MVQESRSLIHCIVGGCKNGGTGDEAVACGASFGDRVTGLAWASVREAGQCGRRPPQRPNGGATTPAAVAVRGRGRSRTWLHGVRLIHARTQANAAIPSWQSGCGSLSHENRGANVRRVRRHVSRCLHRIGSRGR